MQLSAANLLIASQQIARGVQGAQNAVPGQFAAALAREDAGSISPAFEPIAFKKAAPQTAPERPAVTAATKASASLKPPGSTVDIRV